MDNKKKLSLAELKTVELNILCFIDHVCKENNLTYYLAYGTLLGAVRHKGFIPWDDDIDIHMMREDYEKLIEILSTKQDKRYKLLYLTNDPKYYYEFAKVVDSKTSITTPGIIENENEGVWVDIFPLDNVSKCRKIQHFIVNGLVGCRSLSVYKSFPSQKRSYLFYPLWVISKLVGPRFFLKIIEKIAKSGTDKRFIGAIAAVGGSYFYPADYFRDTVELNFENLVCPAPVEYDKYLKGEYGDYMQLPPEDKRICHPMDAFIKE